MSHRFARPLLWASLAGSALLVGACAAGGPSLGSFKVNGQQAALRYATLVAMPPSGDTPRMMLVLSEKAPAAGADPSNATIDGSLGAALDMILVKFDGTTWSNRSGCSWSHPAAKKKGHGWSSIETCGLTAAEVKDGQFHARLVSGTSNAPAEDAVALDLDVRARMP